MYVVITIMMMPYVQLTHLWPFPLIACAHNGHDDRDAYTLCRKLELHAAGLGQSVLQSGKLKLHWEALKKWLHETSTQIIPLWLEIVSKS